VAAPASLPLVERTEEILHLLPLGIALFDAAQNLVLMNAAYCEALALDPEQFKCGVSLEDAMRAAAEHGAFGEGDPEELAGLEIARHRLRDGRSHCRQFGGRRFKITNVPLPHGGHLVSAEETSTTKAGGDQDRPLVEAQVMLDNTLHGVSLWSFDRTLITANHATAELLDVPASLLVSGLSLESLLRFMRMRGAFGSKAEAELHIQEVMSHDPAQPWMIERVTSTGRIVEVRSRPATGHAYMIVTYTDVTEARRIARELQDAATIAQEATAAKARFLATMSHELRTPLNSVIGFSDTLMRDRGTTAPAQAREYAEEINAAGKRLLMLINSMLDVARIEAGRFDLSTDRMDVIRMAQASIRQFRNTAAAAEVDLFSDFPDRLPRVRGDERRMQQVLYNLISNAIKFTEPGGAVTLSAGLEDNGDLVIQVADTGIGISSNQIAHVFEPFTQADSGLTRRYEGSGLGLYFSRALVQAHGGTLTLHSVVGEGTTAKIRMPARRLVDN